MSFHSKRRRPSLEYLAKLFIILKFCGISTPNGQGMQYRQFVQPTNVRASIMARTSATTCMSSCESPPGCAKVSRLSATCASSDIPERMTLQPSRLLTQRIAQEATDQSGRACLKRRQMSSLSVARLPPLTGSMTITGMPRPLASS